MDANRIIEILEDVTMVDRRGAINAADEITAQIQAERDAARAQLAAAIAERDALRGTLREVLDILKSGRSTGRKAIQALYAAEDVLMLSLGK